MREIKFRAWDKANKRMSQVQKWDFKFGDLWVEADEEDWVEQPCFELMQYTGLKDKNGKEIYEGDIVQFDRDNPRVKPKLNLPVIFENGCFQTGIHDRLILSHVHNAIDVIGNIYEYPELLK